MNKHYSYSFIYIFFYKKTSLFSDDTLKKGVIQ